AVLAALPAELHETVRRHVEAPRELRAMRTRLSPTLPAWEIVPPAPYDELLSHYRAAEAECGIPSPYLAAINLVETGTGRIRGAAERPTASLRRLALPPPRGRGRGRQPVAVPGGRQPRGDGHGAQRWYVRGRRAGPGAVHAGHLGGLRRGRRRGRPPRRHPRR